MQKKMENIIIIIFHQKHRPDYRGSFDLPLIALEVFPKVFLTY